MTDLEITRLCAEAMRIAVRLVPSSQGEEWYYQILPPHDCYDPRNDDAQAMALVKSHTLDITWGPGEQRWRVGEFRFGSEQGMNGKDGLFCEVRSTDLNRAICECVAKMQKAK